MDGHTGSEAQATSRLRGRETQLRTLCDQLDAVQAGRGGLVLVLGQAGLGKTALLDVAEGMSGERGIRVFRGTGDAAAQVIPFGPLLEALVSAHDAPVAAASLRDLSQSPDQRFWLLRELQESLERAALRAPVLILVDDLQWADAATLAALGTLPRQSTPARALECADRAGQEARASASSCQLRAAGRRLRARLARMRSSGVVPPQMPSFSPVCIAKSRQCCLTVHSWQSRSARETCLLTALPTATGKNRSGSALRQALAARQLLAYSIILRP